MSEEKDDLESIMVYKFNNTKENCMSLPLSSESSLIAEATMELLMEVFPLLMKEKQ